MQLEGVEELQLGWTPLSQEGLQYIAVVHGVRLRSLHLEHTRLRRGDVAACLVSLPRLRALTLAGLQLEEADLDAGRRQPALGMGLSVE